MQATVSETAAKTFGVDLIGKRIDVHECDNKSFEYLLRELLKRTPSSARREVIEMAALYEHRLTRGQKAIIHLEAFVVAFMDIYLQHNSINSNAMET
ncbi:hypothetical protein COOONC_02343 [Cooperia oncophora]